MRLAAIVLIAVVGVMATIVLAARMWRASRSGAPRELVVGYVALMLATAFVSLALLRLL